MFISMNNRIKKKQKKQEKNWIQETEQDWMNKMYHPLLLLIIIITIIIIWRINLTILEVIFGIEKEKNNWRKNKLIIVQ